MSSLPLSRPCLSAAVVCLSAIKNLPGQHNTTQDPDSLCFTSLHGLFLSFKDFIIVKIFFLWLSTSLFFLKPSDIFKHTGTNLDAFSSIWTCVTAYLYLLLLPWANLKLLRCYWLLQQGLLWLAVPPSLICESWSWSLLTDLEVDLTRRCLWNASVLHCGQHFQLAVCFCFMWKRLFMCSALL